MLYVRRSRDLEGRSHLAILDHLGAGYGPIGSNWMHAMNAHTFILNELELRMARPHSFRPQIRLNRVTGCSWGGPHRPEIRPARPSPPRRIGMTCHMMCWQRFPTASLTRQGTGGILPSYFRNVSISEMKGATILSNSAVGIILCIND